VTSTIRQATQAHFENLQEALRTQSVEITGEARKSNSSFPFVSLPKFELTGQSVRKRSSIEKSSFCPIVKGKHLEAWNQFTIDDQGWIAESWEVSQLSRENSSHSFPPASTRFSHEVFAQDFVTGETSLVGGDGPFLPWWYQTPPPEELGNLNMDILSHPAIAKLFNALLDVKTLVTSDFVNTTLLENDYHYHLHFHQTNSAFSTPDVEGELVWSNRRLEEESVHTINPLEDEFVFHESDAFVHPHSLILYPVFSSLYEEDSDVAGVLLVFEAWDVHLVDLLPETVTKIVLVLKNTCGGAVSYMLYGPKVSPVVGGQEPLLSWACHPLTICCCLLYRQSFSERGTSTTKSMMTGSMLSLFTTVRR
jgi:hypothetical protein